MALTKTTPHTQGQFFLLESLFDEGQPTGDRKKTFGSYPSSFSKPYMVYYGHEQYNIFNSLLRFCVISTEICIACRVYSFFRQVQPVRGASAAAWAGKAAIDVG